MYVTTLKEAATGKTRIFYQHQIRNKETRKKETITIKDLGYEEDYLHLYEDPIQHFKDELQKERDAKKKLKKKKDVVTVSFVRDAILPYNKITGAFNRVINTGDFYILWALNQLEVLEPLDRKSGV